MSDGVTEHRAVARAGIEAMVPMGWHSSYLYGAKH